MRQLSHMAQQQECIWLLTMLILTSRHSVHDVKFIKVADIQLFNKQSATQRFSQSDLICFDTGDNWKESNLVLQKKQHSVGVWAKGRAEVGTQFFNGCDVTSSKWGQGW